MNFTNDVIGPDQLPRYETVPTTAIESNYKKVILWNFGILIIVFGIMNTAGFFIQDFKNLMRVFLPVSILFLGVLLTLQLKAFERRSWAIREHDILYRHGLLSIVTTIIPFNRIQHVSVYEGVFSRMYGLAALKIYTAGGSSSDISISGLKKEDADRVREWILEKIRQ